MSDSTILREEHFDLVVAGTGAAGMAAALRASSNGGEVALLEKSGVVGGTTAISGGVVWAPGNHHARAAGIEEELETLLSYMRRAAQGRADELLIPVYANELPRVIRFVEESLGFTFEPLLDYPDYQPELPGGRAGGRSLDNPLYDTKRLGEDRPLLRRNLVNGSVPITIGEAMRWRVFSNPFGLPYKEVAARGKEGIVHGGAALIGRFLEALLAAGVRPRTQHAAETLIVEDGRVVGVLARTEAGLVSFRARRGVVLASGGFEWDRTMRAKFLPIELSHPLSPPHNTGDALRMAQSVRADLTCMSEAWWTPAVVVPGETIDGAPLHRGEFSVRCLPHAIIVNARGRRFTNEARNYNDMTKPFFDQDASRHEPRNVPAFLIVDAQYMARYVLVTAVKGRPVPDYVTEAASLHALAERVGIDSDGLAAEVERWNGYCETGVDPDFERGSSAFDRFYGDPEAPVHPNFGTIEKGPFYAVPIHPGAMGTKGGPRVDAHARVLSLEGDPIPGLYAAGNAQGSIFGAGYPGAGVTIGQALLFGTLAAEHALS
jgi:3-oxosteroid 1-dehydrogenase